MDWLNLLQWPAMAVTVTATALVSAEAAHWRQWGFWLFLFSNALWIAWGWPEKAWALVALQVILAVMNVRGAKKAEEVEETEEQEAAEEDKG